MAVGATGVGIHLGLDAHVKTVMAAPASPVHPTGDSPVATDLGPLSTGQLRSLEQACSFPTDPRFAVAKVHYARSTSNGSSEAPRQVAVIEDRQGGYHLCVNPTAPNASHTEQSSYGRGVLGPGGKLSPTTERPLSVMSTFQWHYERQGDRFVDVHLAVAYAVTSQVERVEVRLTGAGADGRWFSGTVHGGFVLIPLLVPALDAADGSPNVAIESHGYNADGQLVTRDKQDYLDGTRDWHGNEKISGAEGAEQRHGPAFSWTGRGRVDHNAEGVQQLVPPGRVGAPTCTPFQTDPRKEDLELPA